MPFVDWVTLSDTYCQVIDLSLALLKVKTVQLKPPHMAHKTNILSLQRTCCQCNPEISSCCKTTVYHIANWQDNVVAAVAVHISTNNCCNFTNCLFIYNFFMPLVWLLPCDAMHSADYADARCLSVHLSVTRWYSQPTVTKLFQSPLYGSRTVFCSISRLLRHFLSSAIAWRHTSSNSVTCNYCCRACEVTLSFMDTLIALTYLLILSKWLKLFSPLNIHTILTGKSNAKKYKKNHNFQPISHYISETVQDMTIVTMECE